MILQTCLFWFFAWATQQHLERSERNTTGDTFCCLILRSMHLIRGLSFMHWCTKWREKKKRDEFSNFNLMTTSVMIPMSEKFLIFYSWLHVPLQQKQHSLAIWWCCVWYLLDVVLWSYAEEFMFREISTRGNGCLCYYYCCMMG